MRVHRGLLQPRSGDRRRQQIICRSSRGGWADSRSTQELRRMGRDPATLPRPGQSGRRRSGRAVHGSTSILRPAPVPGIPFCFFGRRSPAVLPARSPVASIPRLNQPSGRLDKVLGASAPYRSVAALELSANVGRGPGKDGETHGHETEATDLGALRGALFDWSVRRAGCGRNGLDSRCRHRAGRGRAVRSDGDHHRRARPLDDRGCHRHRR